VTAMSAELHRLKTSAELALARAFATAKPKLPGDPVAATLRDTAFARFAAAGLPHRQVEDWKYTNLRALMRDAKPLADPPDAEVKARALGGGRIIAGVDCRRLILVNGAFVPELSDLGGLEKGLTIRSMAQALAAGDRFVSTHLGKTVASGDVAVSLNTALMGDGVVIQVAEGANLVKPLHIVSVTACDKPVATYVRNLIGIGDGACVTLVESHEGPADSDYQVNTACDLIIGEAAEANYLKVIVEGADALHISSLTASIGARARFTDVSFITGGGVIRNQRLLQFNGEGAVASIRGASLLNARQHVDVKVVADHVAGQCQSRELFKTVLDGDARSVFQGRITVHPHAQKTDGRMMTRALLLSDTAEAISKPELEIFADDVQCGHGATTGAIDGELKFYLMARGIPAKEAETLLVQAFTGEAIDGVQHAGLREALMDATTNWLAGRG
jgi:Fe-S cluster assembly protein SufD